MRRVWKRSRAGQTKVSAGDVDQGKECKKKRAVKRGVVAQGKSDRSVLNEKAIRGKTDRYAGSKKKTEGAKEYGQVGRGKNGQVRKVWGCLPFIKKEKKKRTLKIWTASQPVGKKKRKQDKRRGPWTTHGSFTVVLKGVQTDLCAKKEDWFCGGGEGGRWGHGRSKKWGGPHR